MTPTQALAELRAHPRAWLRTHHLLAFAGMPPTFAAQAVNFGNTGYVDASGADVFNRTVGTQKSFLTFKGKGTRTFTFAPTASIQAQFVGATVLTSVQNVPVVASASLNGNYVGIALNDLGAVAGQDFAVTTILNGCSYIIDGAGPHVAHIQPTGGMSSAALRTALGGHYTTVYGGGGNEYNHTAEDVTIIGVRRAGGWKIYAQVHDRGYKNVRRVEKLFG